MSTMIEIPRSPVKEVRTALNLTQEEMARRLGCSYATQRRLEYSGKLPRVQAILNNFQKLAKHAGVKVDSAV